MNKINHQTPLKITLLIGVVTPFLLGVNSCDPAGEDLVVVPNKTYKKLDSSGNALTDQSVAWNHDDATASELNFDRWSCLLDEENGLVWEIKTHNDTLRDYKWRYTWYDSNPVTNGGEHGIGDLGELTSTNYENPPAEGTPLGSDNCFDLNRCDTEKFIADVNAVGLCGATDWRLPTKGEFQALGYGTSSPYIDVTYFADVQEDRDNNTSPYRSDDGWTSTTYADVSKAYAIHFGINSASPNLKANQFGIRLVRDNTP